MFKNLLVQFGKKAAMALIAAVLAAILEIVLFLLANYKPEGTTAIIVWGILQTLLTGLVAVIKRWMVFDWSKVGK